MWPTPKASQGGPDYAKENRKGSGADSLVTAVAKFPTPTTVSGHQVGRMDEWGGSGSRSMISHLPKEQTSGQLNPTWVEWLMGFPLGWTDLDAAETP